MKIGIVTYHRTNNYGAVMQALATRFVLEDMGHEAYYVDYWPEYHKEMYQVFPKKMFWRMNILQKGNFLLKLCLYHKAMKKRIENFEHFFQTQVFPYCHSEREEYDAIVYGSDQIWRRQKALNNYNPVYFGKNDFKAKQHVTYAASMGLLPKKEADRQIVKELVSHLDKISVREEGLKKLLLSLGYDNVSLVLDPTLLLSSEAWDRHLPTEPYKGEKYVLVYIIASNAFNLKAIKNFADSKGLKMKVLRGYANTKETKTNITTEGPLEFVRLIKNAEYVFSASFHGLAFSIIYGKQFFTSFKSNSNRAESLLNQLEIKGRLLPPKVSVPQDVPPIDYTEVRGKLQTLRQESLSFLQSI